MIFHCPTCGDVIDVPDSKLPYSGNCPFCAAPVRLDVGKAIDREVEAPPTPPPAAPRPVEPPPRTRVPAPPPRTSSGSKIGGSVGFIILIVVAAIVRVSLKQSPKPKRIEIPRIEVPKYDYQIPCFLCYGSGQMKCPSCNGRQSWEKPDRLSTVPCVKCKGVGSVGCSCCSKPSCRHSRASRKPQPD